MRRIGSRRRATASAAFLVDAMTAAGASSAEAGEEPPIDVAATAAADASSTLLQGGIRRFRLGSLHSVPNAVRGSATMVRFSSLLTERQRNRNQHHGHERDNERERDAHFDEVAETILSRPYNQCVHRRIDGRHERRAGPLARLSSRRR